MDLPELQTLGALIDMLRARGVVRMKSAGVELEMLPLMETLPPARVAPISQEERLAAKVEQLRQRTETMYAASGYGVPEEELIRLARLELGMGGRG